MRSVMTLGLAGVLAGSLLHCAADGSNEEARVAPVDSGTEGASPADATPDADSNVDGSPDVEEPKDAGLCSPDHWCRVLLPTADLDLRAVWSFAPNDALAVGNAGMIHWDGASWSLVTAPNAGLEGLTSLWATGPNDIWGVAEGQRRVVHGSRTTPGAPFTWSKVEYPDGPTMDAIRGFGTSDLWVSGTQDFTDVFQHGVIPGAGADAGADAMPSWTMVPINFDYFGTRSFGVTENNELWAAMQTVRFGPHGFMLSSVVLHGIPNADAYVWEESVNTDDRPFTDFLTLWAPRPDDIWAIGPAGFMTQGVHYHRSAQQDGGIGWSQVPNNVNVSLTAAWGAASDDLWLVGIGGAIRHWDGTSWSVSQVAVDGVPTYDDLTAVHGSSATDVWAVGPGIALHRSAGSSP